MPTRYRPGNRASVAQPEGAHLGLVVGGRTMQQLPSVDGRQLDGCLLSFTSFLMVLYPGLWRLTRVFARKSVSEQIRPVELLRKYLGRGFAQMRRINTD